MPLAQVILLPDTSRSAGLGGSSLGHANRKMCTTVEAQAEGPSIGQQYEEMSMLPKQTRFHLVSLKKREEEELAIRD